MTGMPRAAGYRALPRIGVRSWPSWIRELRRTRSHTREHELEVIERLARLERDRRRRGSIEPEALRWRKWC